MSKICKKGYIEMTNKIYLETLKKYPGSLYLPLLICFQSKTRPFKLCMYFKKCMTKLNISLILQWTLCKTQTQMEIIVDIRRREVTKSLCESRHYVTRPSAFVIVGYSLCWPNTFIGPNSRSSNPEVMKRKSRVSNWKSIPVSYTRTKAFNVRSFSKHAN